MNMPTGFPESGEKTTKKLAVRLKAKGASAVRKGHPWVFEDSIEKISKSGTPGDAAVLFDSKTSGLLGAGLYDPESPVRVKVLSFGKSEYPVGRKLFSWNASVAWKHRMERGVFVPGVTTAFRLIHGESDLFPGIAADYYDGTVVVKIYSEAWLPWTRELLEGISDACQGITEFVVRLSREIRPKAEKCGLHEGLVVPPESDFAEEKIFLENGILFRANLVRGQKTGFFLDQRDNRLRVSKLCAGKKVLNVFSYSGGFSLYAGKGGASEVVSVDLDKHATEDVARNFELNKKQFSVSHREIAGDAFDVMKKLADSGERFGMVIVDPPSFAKAASEVPNALKTYMRLARLAIRLTEKDGVLVFASCSSRVTADELFDAVGKCASEMNRPLTELVRTAHAPDHPALFRESHYLKCLYATVRAAR